MVEWIAAHPYWAVAIPLLSVYFIANIVLFWILVAKERMLEEAPTGGKIVAPILILLFGSLCAIGAVVYDKFLSEKDDDEEKGEGKG